MSIKIPYSTLLAILEGCGVEVIPDSNDPSTLPTGPVKPATAVQHLTQYRPGLTTAILRNWRLNGFLERGLHFDSFQAGTKTRHEYYPRAIAQRLRETALN